ncbi:MAG: SRPBCC family protein [Pseudomonadota bacterium]
MNANHYEFTTHWRVRASLEEVSEVLGDALSLPRWWPAVYLRAEPITSGAPNSHEGGIIALRTRGWLPYTLSWRLRLTENDAPHGFTFEADGDFVGSGAWEFNPDGAFVNVRFDWRVTAQKPLLSWFSWLLRPIFVLNHRWAMARGEESLKLELVRRRASKACAKPLSPQSKSG